jgi:hypothetical protein
MAGSLPESNSGEPALFPGMKAAWLRAGLLETVEFLIRTDECPSDLYYIGLLLAIITTGVFS